MFERNRVDSIDQGTTTVALTFEDGVETVGKLTLPVGRPVLDFMNGANAYVEFEPFEGEKRFIAKTSVRAVRVVQVPRQINLNLRLRDLDGFDPFEVLGVKRGATYDEARNAFFALAKIYHPDRYASAELPEEVVTYLDGMARRITAAWSVIDQMLSEKRRYQKIQTQAIYTSSGRA
jgi:hypothetical protein